MGRAKTDWKHHFYEYWEHHMGDTYTKIEDHGKYGGYNVKISISASSRGAECMEDEINGLIAALQDAKQQIAAIKTTKAAKSGVGEKLPSEPPAAKP